MDQGSCSSVYEQILIDRKQRVQRRSPLRQKLVKLLYLRRRQLIRFAVLCHVENRPLDEAAWLYSLAWTVAALSGRGFVQFKGMAEPQKHWHPILSRNELRRLADEAGLYHLTDVQLQQAEIAACRAPRHPMPDALQGSLLRITAAERDCCRFWTAVAIDETPTERKQRKRKEKRQRDRVAKAARDEVARQSGKRKRRDEYLAECAAQRAREEAFCKKHGISMRTLRNWKKSGDFRCQSLVADIVRSTT